MIVIPDQKSKHVAVKTAVLCLDRLVRKHIRTDAEIIADPIQDDRVRIDRLSEIAVKRSFTLTAVHFHWKELQTALSAGPVLLALRNQNVVLALPAEVSSTNEILVFDPLDQSGEEFFLPRHILEPEWDGDAILVNKPVSIVKPRQKILVSSALGIGIAAAVSGLVVLYPRESGKDGIALTSAGVARPAPLISPQAADSEPEVSMKPPARNLDGAARVAKPASGTATPELNADALTTASNPTADGATAESTTALALPPSAAEAEPEPVKTASAPTSDTTIMSSPGPTAQHSTSLPEPDALNTLPARDFGVAGEISLPSPAATATASQADAVTTALEPKSDLAAAVSMPTRTAAVTVLKPDALDDTPRAPNSDPAAATLSPAPAAGVTVLKPARLKAPRAPSSDTAVAPAPDGAAPAPVPEVDALIPQSTTLEREAHLEISNLGLPPAEIAALIARADALLSTRDLTSARLFYQRAADGGSGQAALRLGETYDPEFLKRIKLNPVQGDVVIAISWYRRARSLGVTEAEILLQSMRVK